MRKINIIPIGSGSTGNSMLIDIGKYKILVDMGLSCKKITSALNVNGIKVEEIDASFITHSHIDHISALRILSKYLTTPIYSSKRTRDNLANKTIGLNFNEKIHVLPDFYVTLFPTSHDCAGSCGYIFEYEEIKIAYVTDLGYLSEDIYNYLKGSGVVIIESNHDIEMLKNGPYPESLKKRILSKHGHLSNKECALNIKKLNESGTDNFFLAHLSRDNNTPELALKESINALKENKANIYVCPIESNEQIEIKIKK